MKVAIVKQVLDVCGPWASVRWRDTTPEHIFTIWPGKAVFWELTCLLQADWFVIPQQQVTDYARWAVLNHPGREALIRSHTHGVVDPGKIPFDDYDLVVTHDAIIDVPHGQKALLPTTQQNMWTGTTSSPGKARCATTTCFSIT